jgi:pteridine reductase
MNNKTVLITGASRRLGAAIARELHHRGMDIVIHYHRSARDAQSLADELNGQRPGSADLVQADLNEASAANHIIEAAVGFNGRLDVLINNASSFYPTPVAEVTLEQWDDLFNTNLKAPFFLAQRAYTHLCGSGGCIINITDIHAHRPLQGYPVYSMAKAGLIMLTMALAREFGPQVRVNAVSPGAIIWPEHMDKQTREKILSRTLMKRCGDPRDITGAINFLINDAAYVTGQVLVIDGGRSLYS